MTTAGPRPALPAAILGSRIVAIARGLDPDRLDRIAIGLAAAGIQAFEVTLDSPGAIDAIRGLAWRHAAAGLWVGAGTVLDLDAAEAAANAGARFLVSPHTDPRIVEWGARHDLPVIPGCFTPTEALVAWRAGATAIKLFPASAAGPNFIRELHGPFPQIPVIATGGMRLENAPSFVAAGAVAVGIGSWLTGDGDPDGIAERGARLVEVLQAPPNGLTR